MLVAPRSFVGQPWLAAEFQTIPEPMRAIVIRFFEDNGIWLSRVLEQGRKERTLRFTGSTSETARFVVATLEGAMLVARPFGDIARFQKAASSPIAGLGGQT
jgi:TetR/AcrR family transcriptional repressor of nem operon